MQITKRKFINIFWCNHQRSEYHTILAGMTDIYPPDQSTRIETPPYHATENTGLYQTLRRKSDVSARNQYRTGKRKKIKHRSLLSLPLTTMSLVIFKSMTTPSPATTASSSSSFVFASYSSHLLLLLFCSPSNCVH